LDPTVPLGRFLNLEEAAGWLGGIIDGEGSVIMAQKVNDRRRRKQGIYWDRYIEFTNTDWGLIEAGMEAYRALGMQPILRARKAPVNPKWKQAWIVTIRSRRDLKRFAQVIRLHSAAKAEKVAAAVASYSTKPQYTLRRGS